MKYKKNNLKMYILLKIGNTCNNKVFERRISMARNNRMKEMSASDKIILYSGIGVVILAIIVTALFLYSKNLNDEVENSTMSLEEMANIANNTTANTESASTQIGKSVEESQNEINSTNNTTNSNTANTVNTVNTNNTTKSSNTSSTTNSVVTTNAENKETETKKEWAFVKPVEGEIAREYAKDNLIYSETLQEWTTHTGIDIKADKTTVVKAAEEGAVKSIKNDPRYGLTIVIEHDEQYQTIYSNLLTSEFVVEGEKVEKGQAIGTVGNTAVFEIADEPHLHFEIWKDSLPIDPTTLIQN